MKKLILLFLCGYGINSSCNWYACDDAGGAYCQMACSNTSDPKGSGHWTGEFFDKGRHCSDGHGPDCGGGGDSACGKCRCTSPSNP